MEGILTLNSHRRRHAVIYGVELVILAIAFTQWATLNGPAVQQIASWGNNFWAIVTITIVLVIALTPVLIKRDQPHVLATVGMFSLLLAAVIIMAIVAELAALPNIVWIY